MTYCSYKHSMIKCIYYLYNYFYQLCIIIFHRPYHDVFCNNYLFCVLFTAISLIFVSVSVSIQIEHHLEKYIMFCFVILCVGVKKLDVCNVPTYVLKKI